ncbi:GNAT family N-acetyltransferase [Isoptericola cucumis]|uniref:N-acetyltransferase n=1 Tax=Isoptericola cucumis TaxID=1776856 RepID=A0ABQ2B5U1_9MICO|nr:GNAT family N-acetyltransferase [Isoptericola cucumis]GGI07252.1 N-acetyltransferase [Isoptericola cucumis]
MIIAPEPPDRADVRELLDEHLAEMRATSPPGSVHALDHGALLAPSITFLTARDGAGALLGCGALAELSTGRGAARGRGHGELKSMRTSRGARGRGVGGGVLAALVDLAAQRRYARVSLETGAQEHFAPARRLYARHGFVECGPFAGYGPDAHSVFMTLALPGRDPV